MKKILCLLLALLLTGCGAGAEEPPQLSGSLTVRCLAGGALVQCNGENLLVDCGAEITAETLKGYGVENLSAVVLTGTGRDGGLEALLETFPAEVHGTGEGEKSFFLDCAAVMLPATGGVKITFGEDSFLFLGTETQAGEDARVLWLAENGSPSEELLSAVNPTYILVDGRADKRLKERYQVFDTQGFGPVTVTTGGKGVTVNVTLFNSDSVAS